jgi:histidine triad (HIT) family protein
MSEIDGAKPDPECIFCKILAGELPGTIVDEDERTVAFMDINPATPGHALVIPRAHSKDLLDIPDDDLSACMLAARRLAKRMEETLDPEGFNILNCCGTAAWQTVFHFHLHVVPRNSDDPLELPWIPKPGDPEDIKRVGSTIKGGS